MINTEEAKQITSS